MFDIMLNLDDTVILIGFVILFILAIETNCLRFSTAPKEEKEKKEEKDFA